MSILDSIKSVASEGLNLASSVEKLAEDGLGTLVDAGKKTLSTAAQLPELAFNNSLTNTITSFLPGIAEAKSLVSVGENILKSNTSGDIFKIQATASIAATIPGLGALVGAAAVASKIKEAYPQQEQRSKDDVFKLVSTDEWKQILSEKNQSDKSATEASGSQSTDTSKNQSEPGAQAKGPAINGLDGIVPRAHVDETGVQFERTAYDTRLTTDKSDTTAPAGQTKIEGDKAIHTDADGTVTTQTGGHTEIQRGDRRIVKNTDAGTTSEYVGDRLAYSQNEKADTQEWNTKQGLRVVEENGEYKIYNQAGVLIGTRPVSVIENELQHENQTLANGDQMRRHLSGRMMDQVTGAASATIASGKEWDVYSDGVSRTLASGETVGMLASNDAFVKVGQATIVRKAQDRKFYLIEEGGSSKELNINADDLAAPLKRAVEMLRGIDQDNKLRLGDGAFLTVRDGKVVGGTDEIVDEPVPAPDGSNTTLSTEPKKVEVTMVTTGKDASTSTLLGGYQSTYEWQSHRSVISEPARNSSAPGAKPVEATSKPIVVIDDRSLTTDDVITTKEGTTDRVTNDRIGHDGSIETANGIKVSAENDIEFADGVKFSHDGTVTLADGTVAREATNHETVSEQASAALSTAISIANAIASKALNGTITFIDIALLQSSLLNVQALVGTCMAAGNLAEAQALTKTGASLEAALADANRSLSLKTIKSNLTANTSNIDAKKYSFLSTQRAA